MAAYYLGGYYVIKEIPVDFGSKKSQIISSCSDCLNDSLLYNWSYSWTTNNNEHIKKIKTDYQLNDETIQLIRQWVDNAFEEKKIGWINLFNDLETAKEYVAKFFSHVPNVKTIGIYFTETEIVDLLTEFKPPAENQSSIGLSQNLSKRLPEINSENEAFIGFDIIGIECTGGFHTFHCHDLSKYLEDIFKLQINQHGLFEDSQQWESVIKYMNDEVNGFEPVPWFVCKTKLVTE
ncbi:MAG: hypothetical protein P4L35_19500 [Ignavibacteriaceae bacterium]|nr:hypothetical protein [Ignavibacteriaceae bacterium]